MCKICYCNKFLKKLWILISMHFWTFWSLKLTKVTKCRVPKIAKNGSFTTLTFSKIDFTWNLNDKKSWNIHTVSTAQFGSKKFTTLWNRVWKFHDFFITQILREIKFWNSTSAKSAILTHLEALNFDFYDFLLFLEVEMYQMNKIQSP